MNLKLLHKDFRKNLWSNLVLFLFMALSVAIAVTVTLSLTRLFSSISAMYETARPPHFLQMHKGELKQSDIDEFNRDYGTVEHWQTVSMLNLSGSDITVSKLYGEQFTMADCRLDLSFVKQNEEYDVLLDESRQPLAMKDGQIGVPVILLEQYDISIGDTILLNTGSSQVSFKVVSYVCDGQMNSTLCSSTRFLISDADFGRLSENVGEKEYLIETWFSDSSEASKYQTAYEQSSLNLPKNGQAITYSMIFLLSAMTDLLMAVIFLLAGVLLIIIAMVCLRYVVLTELESDMTEIGTMKAIGIPAKGIRGIYLGKIQALLGAGCLIGFLLAYFLSSLLAEHMSRTFGTQKMTPGSYILALAVCLAVYGIILAFSKKLFYRLNQVSVTDLLVTEKGFGKRNEAKNGLWGVKCLPFNLSFGLHEVKKGYGLIFGLLLMVTILMSVPWRIVQTLDSEEFVTYMGSSLCDLFLEVEQGEELEERNNRAGELLLESSSQGLVAHYSSLRRVRLQALKDNGDRIGIHIDSGQEIGADLNYLEGGKPETQTEIALSSLMADELEKTVGEPLFVITDKENRKFTISGIYQDVTSGGRTAKTIATFPEQQAEKYAWQVDFSQSVDLDQQAQIWRKQLGNGYSIEGMKEFVGQTLGGVSTQTAKAAGVIFLIGTCLVVLIVLLFLKLRIARNAGTLAVKRAIGIPFIAICMQELYPVWIAGGMGIMGGVLLTELLGDKFISGLFMLMNIGISRISFADVSLGQYLMIPMVLMLLLTVVTCGICRQIKVVKFVEYFNE